MTIQEAEKLYKVIRSSLIADFGRLGDLPIELANCIANVYYRYFEMAIDSNHRITGEEIFIRRNDFETAKAAVPQFRELQREGVNKTHLKMMEELFIDVFKYRIQDALNKMPIRRMIERKFRNDIDKPDLVRSLQLYV